MNDPHIKTVNMTFEMIRSGKSDEEITQFLIKENHVKTFGDIDESNMYSKTLGFVKATRRVNEENK